MSEPLRIALVTEGPTDRIVLGALLPAVLGRDVVISAVHPDDTSLAFGGGPEGFGWQGVLRWCEARSRPDEAGLHDVLAQSDILALQLDGDVARALGCTEPCPPAARRAEFLRRKVADALGPAELPAQVVVAVPMDALEGWLLRILRDAPNDECSPDPASQFVGGKPKLVEQASRKKVKARYLGIVAQVASKWERARDQSQFQQFLSDLDRAIASKESA